MPGIIDRLPRSRHPAPSWAPEPPVEPPPGRLVHVPGRGEFFLRDSGGDRTPVLLLHGWMFPSDLNWFRCYEPLAHAGYRVLAIDHRGHGRGLRTHEPFRLEDCAHDAAAVLERLGVPPALAVGYSMGGPIAQLLARDHPDRLRGMVLCATAREWQNPRMKLLWNGMAGLRLALNFFPYAGWRTALRAGGFPDGPVTSWVTAELTRGSGRDIAEAGRELGRYDSRPWIGSLTTPAAVVVTTKDTGVPPDKQYALARALGAPAFDFAGDHAAVTVDGEAFAVLLVRAVRDLEARTAQGAIGATTSPPAS